MPRPRSTMTPEAIAAILRSVRLGLYPDQAAKAAGVATATMRAHKRRHPKFAEQIAEAEAAAEQAYLARVIRHTEKHWQAAAWLLERRWADRWARRDPDVAAAIESVAASNKPAAEMPSGPALSDWLGKLNSIAAVVLAQPAAGEASGTVPVADGTPT